MRKAAVIGLITATVGCMPIQKDLLQNTPENISHINQVVAEHMYERCLPGMEQVTIYLTSKDQLINITRKAGYSYAGVNQELLEEAMRTENYLIEDHCHIWAFELYIKEISEKRKKGQHQARQSILENGPAIARQRSLLEIPSIIDLDQVLKDTLIQYRLNPQGTIRKRIYTIEEGAAPRLISFGLQKEKENSYKGLAKGYLKALAAYEEYEQTFPHTAIPHELVKPVMESASFLDSARISYLSSFQKGLDTYQSERCKPENKEECIEPSYKEFYDRVNKEGIWFIEDLGHVQIKHGK